MTSRRPLVNVTGQFLPHVLLQPVFSSASATAESDNLHKRSFAGDVFGESIVGAAYLRAAYAAIVSSRRFEQRGGLPADCLGRVLDYIDSNLDRDLRVTEVSRVALISSYHFGKLFKRSTGRTIHQYVLDHRIRKARSLLVTSNATLIEIASMVGLANQSHFTTAFKKKMGVPPGRYRSLSVRSRWVSSVR
jgi:AraC-like DNA-binding protein